MQLTTLLLLCLTGPTGQVAAPQRPESPAERGVRAARAAIEAEPEQHAHYNDLALALARRARESARSADYEEAEQALARSLELAPENYGAERLAVWLMLGRHEFARALEAARELNRRAPDDLMVYGYLVDACVELGLYAEAEEACQWMLDLRPGAVPGLTRAAYLRELFGDVEAAAELLVSAYGILPASEVEDRAWVLTHLAGLYLALETPAALELAEHALDSALVLFPDYHYALKQLALARQRRGESAEVVRLLRRRFELAPHPENLFDLAAALQRAGRSEEAAALFLEFEHSARAEMESADNANGELIRFYLEPEWSALYPADLGPEEALCIAEREVARRGGMEMRLLLARAQLAVGRAAEARSTAEGMLASGLRTAPVLDLAARLGLSPGEAPKPASRAPGEGA
jgi:tetratricopeptide (TPR) repeat protein